jgi:PAS domain S-box-containing protein
MKIFSTDSPKYECNPCTISFSKDLEKEYLNSSYNNSLRHVRIGLLLAIFFYGLFGILDHWIVPEVKKELWIIRYVIFCPFVLVIYLFSFSQYFKKYMQLSIFTVVLLAGVGIIAMIVIAPDPINFTYYAGLILVFIYGYTFFKLRFIWATIAGWTIVILYEIVGYFIIDTPFEIFISNNFFFLCGNLIGMIAGYSIEYYSRRDFIQNLLLEEEKKKVDEARRFLETKVDERTHQLVKVNEKLLDKIREQKHTEEALKKKIELESFISNISTQFINLKYDELDNGIKNTIQSVGEFAKADRSYLYINNSKHINEDPEFKLYHKWTTSPDNEKNSFPILELSWIINQLKENKSVVINCNNDLMTIVNKEDKKIKSNDIKSLIEIPLILNDKIFGFIGLESFKYEKKWPEDNISLLKLIGDLLILAFDRENKERLLQKSEKEYRTLFEKSSDVVFISTPDGKFTDINKAGIELFGYQSKDEILSCNIAEDLFVNPTDRIEFRKLIERDNQIKDFEIKLKNKQGNEIIALETTTAFRDKVGNIIAYHGIIRDITNKRKFEQHLFQSQKMESIGMLAGGIAHDFNNILTALKGYADIALLKIQPDSPNKKEIIGISRGIERAENLIRQLLAFGRKQIIEPKVININELILNLEKMLIRLIGEDINLDAILTDDIEYIKADPGQIEQVLVNLAINARDAINQKNCKTKYKKITIETKSKYIDFSYAQSHPEMKVGNYLLIAVSDTGIGMNSEIISKIYEPFYTTKDHGKGTGLGLSTVYGIIKQNHGHVYAYSEINKGSTFKIYWPATDQDIEPMYSNELENDLINGHETILFVEDDYEVRNTICEALNSLNYKIIEASNGVEAMNIVKQNNIKLDMLITDVVMPEMGGKELANEILKYFPGIDILFTSGYTSNHIVRSGRLEKGINFLHKPFSIKDLSQKIRYIIDN